MDTLLQGAADDLGGHVVGLMVRMGSFVFDLTHDGQTWLASYYTATDIGEAACVTAKGSTPQEALDECLPLAEQLERDGAYEPDEAAEDAWFEQRNVPR